MSDALIDKEKVAIIVLNWNGKKETSKCLQSLENLSYSPIEVIIVDNGSTDGSPLFFKNHFPHFTLIETHENLGYAEGNNVGIRYALDRGYSFFFILNNDTTVEPGIIEAFLELFDAHPKLGVLGSKIYLWDDPKRFDHFGGYWNSKKLDFDYVGYRVLDDEKSWDTSLPLDYVCGAGIMIHRSVIETVGMFDSRFFLFWEEADFCFRARKAGFSVLTCPKAKIWHKVSASFVGGKPHTTYFFWRNRMLWIEKNFSGLKRIVYLLRLLCRNLPLFYGGKILRHFQIVCQKCIGSDPSRNRERIIRYNAALSGMKDYLFRHFKSGNSNNFMNCH